GNGEVSFALVPNNADGVNANSREQTSGKPTLTVTFGCAGTGDLSPTATFTSTPTTTPTNTPTDTPTDTPTNTPTATTCVSRTRAFVAAADAFVYQTNPTTNSGSSVELRARLSATAQYESYLRFDVTGLSGPVTQAVLQVTSANYAGAGTASAPDVRLVTGAWAEASVTWATKPAHGAVVAAGGGAWGVNAVYAWDVSAAVASDGSISFALIPISTDAVNANSREQTSGKPVLAVTTCAPATPTPVPAPTSTPAAGDAVLVAVGDIACPAGRPVTSIQCQQMATSDVALAANPDLVLALGDTQYECGTLSEYNASYDPSWGRLKAKTRPVIGNHEYNIAGGTSAACPDQLAPSGAEGYWAYFGGAAANPQDPTCVAHCLGYYSFDVGAWHVVVLNSMLCVAPFNQCGSATSPQVQWLRSDLAAHPNQCTLAAWHHPLYGTTEKVTQTRLLWQALYDYGAEVVLVGHAHRYERYGPMNATGVLDTATGIREFIVGTGGEDLNPVGTSPSPNFEIGNAGDFGVLRMNLRANGYDWQFLPIAGGSFTDSGSASCHGAPTAAVSGPVMLAMDVSGTNDGGVADHTHASVNLLSAAAPPSATRTEIAWSPSANTRRAMLPWLCLAGFVALAWLRLRRFGFVPRLSTPCRDALPERMRERGEAHRG
ncbi:MAG: acid phosphatase type 7, partial [Thermomicrobiales bacterium]|nr:acid phosphatase type 7 [Thermomicrobiales bacterium]